MTDAEEACEADMAAPKRKRQEEEADGDIVRLNVGGRHFDTSRATLLAPPTSPFFSRLLDEEWLRCSSRGPGARLFLDRDPDNFALILKELRGTLVVHMLSEQQRAELAIEADYYDLAALADKLRASSPEAERFVSALSPEDRAIREQAIAIRTALRLNRPGAAAMADAALIDFFEDPDSFRYTGQPTSPGAPLLHGFEQQAKRGAARLLHSRIGEKPRCTDAASFRARLDALAGGSLLNGLDLTNLVVAGGSVLLAMNAHVKDDAAGSRKDWADVDEGADIDLFIVTDDDDEARKAYERVRTHLQTALLPPPDAAEVAVAAEAAEAAEAEAGAQADQAAADVDAAAGAAGAAAGAAGAVADAAAGAEEEVAEEGEEMEAMAAADEEAWAAMVQADPQRWGAIRFRPPAMRSRASGPQLLVVRSKYCVTFYAGHPHRAIQLVLRRHRCIGEVVFNFDVDGCQFAYCGTTRRLLATPAARRALASGINIADPERSSPTYEVRQAKYAQRGFAIALPGVDPARVDRRWLSGTFTRQGGRLSRVALIFKERERLPSAELVGSEITRLRKLLVLSSVCTQYPDDDGGNDFDDAYGGDEYHLPRSLARRMADASEGQMPPLLASQRAEPGLLSAPPLLTGQSFLVDLRELDRWRAKKTPLSLEKWVRPTPPSMPPHMLQQPVLDGGRGGRITDDYAAVLLPFSPRCSPAIAYQRLCNVTLRTEQQPVTFVFDLIELTRRAIPVATPHIDDARHGQAARFDRAPNELPRCLEFPPSSAEGPWYHRQPERGWYDGVHLEGLVA